MSFVASFSDSDSGLSLENACIEIREYKVQPGSSLVGVMYDVYISQADKDAKKHPVFTRFAYVEIEPSLLGSIEQEIEDKLKGN